MTTQGWTVERARGSAADFHARDIPAVLTPSVWSFEVERPALVLGSGQPIDHIDLDACRTAGVDVVRRRSGGGAVLLEPGDVTWIDVLIPTAHHRWTGDVSSSAWWLGDVWRLTLGDLGIDDATVHTGPMISTPWSSRICFAGTGGGEVVRQRNLSGALSVTSKFVGVSQRRSRIGARFQCAVHRTWRPAHHVPLFRSVDLEPALLDGVTATVDAPSDDVLGAFLARLVDDTRAASA